ncbi:putative signal transducing protein [Pseudomonas taetrolens]|uniref:putative signal transducing protein n=1 Tax=Pseudomonas taetrolens TaxID=47884 RepID=UPI003F9D9605
MQRIYEPESLMEAELLLGMLASEGIEARLQGRDLIGGAGELPALGLLGLAVADDQALYARELIDAYNAASPVAGDEPESFPDVLVC